MKRCFRLSVSCWKDRVNPLNSQTQRYTWFWSDRVWCWSFFRSGNYPLCWWDRLKHNGVSVFGLCFSILTRRFAFPLLLELGLGASSCLHLSSLPTDCLVVVLPSANATLLAPCWTSSLLASAAVTSSASITLLLALASFATRRCPWSRLRFVPPGYGVCC